MKFNKEFSPVTVVFETQEEIDKLAKALYDDVIFENQDKFKSEEELNALKEFRLELFRFSTEDL